MNLSNLSKSAFFRQYQLVEKIQNSGSTTLYMEFFCFYFVLQVFEKEKKNIEQNLFHFEKIADMQIGTYKVKTKFCHKIVLLLLSHFRVKVQSWPKYMKKTLVIV